MLKKQFGSKYETAAVVRNVALWHTKYLHIEYQFKNHLIFTGLLLLARLDHASDPKNDFSVLNCVCPKRFISHFLLHHSTNKTIRYVEKMPPPSQSPLCILLIH